MPYIEKHRPLISHRLRFRPAPYPPRPLITSRITFTNEQLQRSTRNQVPSRAPSEVPEGSHEGRRRALTPLHDDEAVASSRRSRRVTILESSPETDDHDVTQSSRPRLVRSSSTRRLRSAPPETRSSTRQQGPSDLVEKPQGEPGRPNSGGHSAEDELVRKQGWSIAQYDALYAAVKGEARAKLDSSKCFRSQKKEVVKSICLKLTNDPRWPSMDNYEECWPVISLLKMTLKAGLDAQKSAQAKRVITAAASLAREV